MKCQALPLQKIVQIDALYAVQYYELSRDFLFPEETYDFWEMIYVDKGELLVTSGEEESAVCGDLFFYRPGQQHGLRGNGIAAANVMMLGFQCDSEAMESFGGRCIRPNLAQKSLLKDILKESRAAFVPENASDGGQLRRTANAPIGSEQMIEMYMVELLISLLRRMKQVSIADKGVPEVPVLEQMIAYMEENLTEKMTMDKLAKQVGVSTSSAKRLFAQYKQVGAIRYFTMLKIDYAKRLLRQNDCNIAQIAEQLGFDSSTYFSNRFKKFTGMSPTEYRRSITAYGCPKQL